MKNLKYLFEYMLLRGLSAFICVLPYRGALAVGWVIAWLGHYVVGFRANTARSRIREIFGSTLSEKEVRRIAWLSWRNFIFSGVDMMRIPVMTEQWIKEVVIADNGIEQLVDHVRTGRGAIIATIHMGAWEMGGIACMRYGIPMFSLVAKQKNPYVDGFINRLRTITGFESVPRETNVLKGIIERIKQGKALAILPDVRSPTRGVPVRFLGATANVGGGLGMIARLSGEPVFPCVVSRSGWTRHNYRVFTPVLADPSVDKKTDRARVIQDAFNIFDSCVRAEPEQWFWYNKRWLFDPLDETGKKGKEDDSEIHGKS